MVFFRQALLNKIIFIFPFFILGILLFLSFYCHPTAEDIAIKYYNDTKGLSANIRDFYTNDSSRYFSFPLLFAIFNGEFFITHYYLVPIALVVLLFASIYNFIRVAVLHTRSSPAKKNLIAWVSALIVITFFAVSFETASIFYWASGSITYLPAFILFLILGAQLILLFSNKKLTPLALVCSILCVAAICGSNEISLFFLFGILVGCQFVFYRLNKKLNGSLIILILTVIACVIFLIIPAGSGKRAHDFTTTFSLLNALLSAFLYTVRTLYHVISVPLVWVLIIISWNAGQCTSGVTKKNILKSGVKAVHAFLFTSLLSFCFYFVINFLSGELLPPRANNLMAFYTLLFILLSFFLAGVLNTRPVFSDEKENVSVLAGIGLLIIFFTSPLFINSIGNVFTGYFYNKVMNDREASVAKAKKGGGKTVELFPYNKDYEEQLQRTGKSAKALLEKLDPYPSLIHYLDPVADTSFYIYYYAAFKNIDTIQYQGKKFAKRSD